ncbi:MAG: YdcF family protein [Planctomycetota bacterium]
MTSSSAPGASSAPPAGRRRARWLVRAAGLGALAGWTCGALTLLVLGRERVPERAELGVVLGNRVEPSGEPSAVLGERLERALELYRAGRVERLLVSGGLGAEGFVESEVMARWLVARGVPRERVLEDPLGSTTFHTARHTVGLLRARGWRRVVAVSSDYHLLRCRLALRRAGVADEDLGLAGSSSRRPRDLYAVPRELAGLVYYALRRDFTALGAAPPRR